MATIPIKFILVIILACAIYCDCQSDNPGVSSSWAKLQISPDTLSSMEYGNFLIEIYEHANNHKETTTAGQKKYFFSPLALLEFNSAVCIYNRFTKRPEMRFRVEMWNDKVQNEVVKHLNEIVGQEIKSNQVTIIPLKKVILSSNVPTEEFSLSPVWTNYDKSKTLWLYLSCNDQKACDELANEIRSNPTQLHHLKLLYSLSSQTSQTKQTTISIDSVTSGQMVTKLLQKFVDKKEIFLTANDEKKMLMETATNIRMETFEESEVGSPETETQIYNILKDLLITSRTTIKEQSDKMWDSVFWNDDNYRPDKTTKTLNEIINKLDKETQKKLADMFQIQQNYDAKSWADVDRISLAISGKLANDSDSSRRVEILMEDVEKLLQESKNYVEWDGDKFVPKPMQLSRINLGKFRDSQLFQDRNVRVRYTNAELSAPIKFMEHTELTVTDEWNNLKEELKAIRELLNTTMVDLVKSNAELIYVKRDFTNKLEATEKELADMKMRVGNLSTELKTNSQLLEYEIGNSRDNMRKELTDTSANNSMEMNTELIKVKNDLISQLEGTKQELEKTKIELEKTRANVIDSSSKLNATEKELAEMKIRTGNLATEFKTYSLRLGHEIKVAEENLRKELRATLNHLETSTTNLNATMAELRSAKLDVADLKTKLHARTSEIVDIGKMPTSCFDLERMGHKLSGFFSVKGSKKIEMLYCDFNPNQNDKQKWIGYVDVKKILALTRMPTSCEDLWLIGHTLNGFYSIKGAKMMDFVYCNFTKLPGDEGFQERIVLDWLEAGKELESTKTSMISTRNELIKTKSTVDDLMTKLKAWTSEVFGNDIGQMPTSCLDLERMGHKLSGFFSVKGSKKMEMIYCNFNPNGNDKQKWIGYADIKSAPVHFYVQRNSRFTTTATPITFDLARVNEGNAMNLTSGKFTAPRPGIYFFSFTGHAILPRSSSLVNLDVGLYLNGDRIGTGYVEEGNTVKDQFSPFSLHSTLNLKKDDQIWVRINYISPGIYLYDTSSHYTHFTGFMLEEEIVASL